MSKKKEVKVLKHAEVHKKIIAHPPVPRPREEQCGPLNKYRDELFERYNRKKRMFFEVCKKYNRLNQELLISGRKRLLEDYRELLDCDDLVESDGEECSPHCPCEKADDGLGKLIRMRTERPIHKPPEPQNEVCCIEPWFRRYLTLHKFIWAARTIIIKNRLLKALEKLKTVDAATVKALENRQRRFLNVSYEALFEQFM